MTDSFVRAEKAGKVNDPVATSLLMYGGPRVDRNMNIKSIVNNQVVNKLVSIPVSQSFEIAGLTDMIYYIPSTTPSTTIFNTGGRVDILVRNQSAEIIKEGKVIFNLAEVGGTDSVTVIPGPYFIQRLEVWADGGSGDLLQTIYGDNIVINTAFLSTENMSGIGVAMGLTTTWGATASCTIAAGGHVTFYVNLLGLWTELVRPYVSDLSADILFRFYLNNGVVSSGTGVLNLTGMSLDFEADEIAPYDKAIYNQQLSTKIFRTTFLDVVPISGSYAMAANTEIKVPLENFVGKCAFLVFFLRLSDSATSNGYITFTGLGNSGTVDMISATNTPILGHGTRITSEELLYCIFNKNFPSNLANNIPIYYIPFTKNPVNAVNGIIENYFYFDGSRYQLSIIPDSTFTAGTYNVHVYAYIYKDIYQNNGRFSARWS